MFPHECVVKVIYSGRHGYVNGQLPKGMADTMEVKDILSLAPDGSVAGQVLMAWLHARLAE